MNNAYLAKAKQVITDPQILSIVAAKRARQLALGGRQMIKCNDENYLDVALLEIGEGLLTYEFISPEEVVVAAAEAAAAAAAAAEEEKQD